MQWSVLLNSVRKYFTSDNSQVSSKHQCIIKYWTNQHQREQISDNSCAEMQKLWQSNLRYRSGNTPHVSDKEDVKYLQQVPCVVPYIVTAPINLTTLTKESKRWIYHVSCIILSNELKYYGINMEILLTITSVPRSSCIPRENKRYKNPNGRSSNNDGRR
jgi:hypothetical protein